MIPPRIRQWYPGLMPIPGDDTEAQRIIDNYQPEDDYGDDEVEWPSDAEEIPF